MLILKGIIIGIGKIIPGVSGSMLAISMGIYQKLIDSINSFFKTPKQNFKFLFKIGIGVIISMVFLSNLILDCLNKYYLVTIFFFIGLIICGCDDIKQNTSKKYNYIAIISFVLITLLGFINIDNQVNITNIILNFLYFLFIGFVDALTMVVPGISGTATLMMLGAYEKVIELYSNIFNLSLLLDNLKLLIPYILGIIIGMITTVKLINFLFKSYKEKTYSAILGFSISTIVLMFIKSLNSFYTLKDLIIAFVLLFIGIFITKKINHVFND
ncbi:MAG: DUF368 domain-containing protein [Firmicutes bacterium]|nr:DUF368 domain-containing protein [Bacillota bacterium]